MQAYADGRGGGAASVRRGLWFADAVTVAAASAVAQLVALLQGTAPIDAAWLLVFTVLAIVLLAVEPRRPGASVATQIYAALSATALAALVVVTLRLQAGVDPAVVGETVRQWAFVGVYVVAGRTAVAWRAQGDTEAAQADGAVESVSFSLLAARELARARRHELPLTVLVLDPISPPLERARRARDVERLEHLLADELRLTDAFGVLDGRVVAVLPDTRSEEVGPMLQRIHAALDPELHDRVESGVASFPDEETTFAGLLERALDRRAQPFDVAATLREALA